MSKEKGEESVTFNPADYPRTYLASRRNALSNNVVAGILAAAGLVGAWFFGMKLTAGDNPGALTLAILCLALTALGFVLMGYTWNYRVVLSADAIEVRSWWRTKTMRRADIAGWRTQQDRRRSMVYLEASKNTPRFMAVATIIHMDGPFKTWFESLPNLDKQEYERSKAEIAADPALGATEAERLRKLKNARSAVGVLFLVSFAAFLWGGLRPVPYLYAMGTLAFLPMVSIGLYLRYPHVFQLPAQRNSARASLLGPMVLPTVALALRAWYDVPMLEHGMVIGGALVTGLALIGILVSLAPELREQRRGLLVLALVLWAYSYGVMVHADAFFDRKPAQLVAATVKYKTIIHGKSWSYELRLSPVGDEADPTVKVSPQLYNATEIGGAVCINLHSGALEIPWYRVHGCPQETVHPAGAAPK